MEGCNPILDWSLKFKWLTSSVFAPYDEMLKDVRQKAKQTGLAQSLELLYEGKVPTTSSQTQSSEAAQMSACQPLHHLQNEFHLALQHARLPCPSLSPGACSDSHSLSVMPSNYVILCRPFLLLLLAFALLHFVRQGQTCLCTPGSLSTSYFCTPIPYEKDF